MVFVCFVVIVLFLMFGLVFLRCFCCFYCFVSYVWFGLSVGKEGDLVCDLFCLLVTFVNVDLDGCEVCFIMWLVFVFMA